MSVGSLYGRLSAAMHDEYMHRVETMNRNMHRINAFGETIAPFGLDGHVNPKGGELNLVAVSKRGVDHAALLADLKAAGFFIGTPIQPSTQFNDGFEIWTVPVRRTGLEFTLLFYIPL